MIRRRLFSVASGTSLLFFVAASMLWVHSYWAAYVYRRETLFLEPRGHATQVLTAMRVGRGEFCCEGEV